MLPHYTCGITIQDTASYLMPGNRRRYLFRNYSLEAFSMDCAILACYGWQDIDLQHNFYQDERGQIRYMVSDIARREILVRLLRINHEVALSEGVQNP